MGGRQFERRKPEVLAIKSHECERAVSWAAFFAVACLSSGFFELPLHPGPIAHQFDHWSALKTTGIASSGSRKYL